MTHQPTATTSLKELYTDMNAIKQAEFRAFVADTLGKRSRSTLHNWLNDVSEPTRSEKLLIAKYFDQPAENIFQNLK